jgi:hypothetical protein
MHSNRTLLWKLDQAQVENRSFTPWPPTLCQIAELASRRAGNATLHISPSFKPGIKGCSGLAGGGEVNHYQEIPGFKLGEV